VLLGDPQQLEQPIQGSHPEGAGVSALEHLLGGEQTMPDDGGLFLAETRRRAPAIYYDGRLRSRPGCERQRLAGSGDFVGAGLRLVGVEHEGNPSSSPEEAERVAEAPARRLAARLPGARVGTVDKFHCRQAPVVIDSVTTSFAGGRAARNGRFPLYSRNRLNIAPSRHRARGASASSSRTRASSSPSAARRARCRSRTRSVASRSSQSPRQVKGAMRLAAHRPFWRIQRRDQGARYMNDSLMRTVGPETSS
jgi:hypothetical protein